MNGDTSAKFDILTLSEAELVDQACDRFETAWRSGDWPCIEGYLDAAGGRCRITLLHELIKLELELRLKVSEQPTAEEYRRRFPEEAPAIDLLFGELHGLKKDRSTVPDEVLGSRVPDPDAATVAATTLELGSGTMVDFPEVDGSLGRLLGEYVILDRLGSGGMGVVYRAFQRNANRLVALKLIRADWCGASTEVTHREAERRFRTEAQVLAGLEHDHIVPLYDAGHAEGLLFFSMQLISGRSLGQIVLSEGSLPPRRAAYYIEAIARAIQYAHEHHVVHRDVKPGNILIGANDRPYLIDLGLAKSLDATDFTTLTGKALGTAEYMSPEQARGSDQVGFASDVYGLGATLFTLLTGRPPFSGPSPLVVLRKVIDEEPAWPRDYDRFVGAELKAICLKCLEKNPARRFASAGELAVVLKKYLTYEPTGVSRPRPWERIVKWVRRQPWRAAAATMALLAFVIAVSAWAWNGYKSSIMSEGFIHDVQFVPLASLPTTIDRLAGYRGWVNPRLHALVKEKPGDLDRRTRVGLALLPAEPGWALDLVERLVSGSAEEHRVICDALRGHRQAALPALRSVFDDQRADAGRRTKAAAALMALGGTDDRGRSIAEVAWSELRLAPDPGARMALLEWLVKSKLAATVLGARLDVEPDISARRMLIQALGGLGDGQPPAGLGATFTEKLRARYRQDSDPGVHSSLAYLFRRWGMESEVNRIDKELAGGLSGRRNWYVTTTGLTMAVIDVPQAARPLPPQPGQPPVRFAIATTETPLSLFAQFDPAHAARRLQGPDVRDRVIAGAPADELSYFDAARFCNWLSQREGIPAADWCYRPGRAPGVMVLEADYQKRRGYRLPTIPEWDFAARAGTATDRYFGRDLTLSGHYAWHQSNSEGYAQKSGRLRPNDFGLFDVLGNLMELCHNPVTKFYPDCAICPSTQAGACELRLEAVKGGCFLFPSELQRVPNQIPRSNFSADDHPPDMATPLQGFRVLKSIF
jgi:serine/threonine protein kinase/formylglycine-generating enzyme required for sulfatase activity